MIEIRQLYRPLQAFPFGVWGLVRAPGDPLEAMAALDCYELAALQICGAAGVFGIGRDISIATGTNPDIKLLSRLIPDRLLIMLSNRGFVDIGLAPSPIVRSRAAAYYGAQMRNPAFSALMRRFLIGMMEGGAVDCPNGHTLEFSQKFEHKTLKKIARSID